jgi:uncharacterized protein YodC (DUF2158 family)
MKFKSGDTVKLKSGGPEMTISEVHRVSKMEGIINEGEIKNIECQWFSGKKLQKGFFDPDAIIKVENSEKET